MFLAIINDTYAEVKSELSESEDDFAIMDYFKSHYHGLLGKLGKHQDQIEGIQAALKVSPVAVACIAACLHLLYMLIWRLLAERTPLFACIDADNHKLMGVTV